MDKKILLVDDAAFMRMLIKDALTKNGYTNILEGSTPSAWRRWWRYLDSRAGSGICRTSSPVGSSSAFPLAGR